MTNRLPTILTIIASVFFLVTTFLGLTDVGGNLYYLWTDFYFIEFLKTVIIVSLVGIFLGLFLFRKWRFVERVKRTLPIAFIVFSFFTSLTGLLTTIMGCPSIITLEKLKKTSNKEKFNYYMLA